MTQAKTRRALETAVQSWATANSISVAWENVPFTPSTSSYAAFNLIPAQSQALFLEGSHRGLRGIAQVTIYTPSDAGPGAADALVDSLQSYLEGPLTADGQDVYITAPPTPAPALQEPGWHVVPVSCEYRADYIVTTVTVATYITDASGNRLTDASGNYIVSE